MATSKQEVNYKKSVNAKAISKTSAYKKMRRACKVCHDMEKQMLILQRQALLEIWGCHTFCL